jgi:plasmid stability protein
MKMILTEAETRELLMQRLIAHSPLSDSLAVDADSIEISIDKYDSTEFLTVRFKKAPEVEA